MWVSTVCEGERGGGGGRGERTVYSDCVDPAAARPATAQLRQRALHVGRGCRRGQRGGRIVVVVVVSGGRGAAAHQRRARIHQRRGAHVLEATDRDISWSTDDAVEVDSGSDLRS